MNNAENITWREDAKDLDGTLLSLKRFLYLNYGRTGHKVNVWANSPSFDIEILENAAKTCGVTIPEFNFRNRRDLRTITAMCPEVVKNFDWGSGTYHNALDDCRNQIRLLKKCLKELRWI